MSLFGRMMEAKAHEQRLPNGVVVRAQPGMGRKGAGWAFAVTKPGTTPFVSAARWKTPQAALKAGVRSETEVTTTYLVLKRGDVSVLADPDRRGEAEKMLPPSGTTIASYVSAKTPKAAIKAWRRQAKADKYGLPETLMLEGLFEKVGCHDRVRDQYRPDIPDDKKIQATAARMSDLASGLKSALMCREKGEVDRYMTLLGKALTDVKNTINSKAARRAFDYEQGIMFPERRKLKTIKREPAKVKA